MSKQPKLSEWISPDIKPVLPGIYELDITIPFHYWDGRQWLEIAEFSPEQITKSLILNAGPMPEFIGYTKTTPWRGLSENPEK